MGKRIVLSLVMLGLMLVSCGCWDRIELDERGFVIGIAIDAPKDESMEQQAEKEDLQKPKGKQRFTVTYQMVVPAGLKQGGGMEGGGNKQAYFNITSEDDTMQAVASKLATRSSRSPFFEHLEMIIISEELARRENGFADVLNFFITSKEARREVMVLISKGEARKALEVKAENEKIPVQFIESISNNERKSARMLPQVRLGDVHGQLLRNTSYVIPRIVHHNAEVAVAGAVVMDGNENTLVGFLGEEETKGLNFITDQVRGGEMEARIDGSLIAYGIERVRRTIKADVRDINHIRFTVKIETEGDIVETLEPLDFLNEATLIRAESAIEREIERICKDTVSKLQKEFKRDAIGLGEHLRQSHYKAWKKMEGDWESGEQYFTQCEVEFKAKVNIRRVGTVNFTEGDN